MNRFQESKDGCLFECACSEALTRWAPVFRCLVVGACSLFLTIATGTARAAGAAGANPLKLMPANVGLYLEINEDAGKTYLDSIKETKLGYDIQALIEGRDEQSAKTIRTVRAMLQGFGPTVSLGVIFPKGVISPPRIGPAPPGGAPPDGPAAGDGGVPPPIKRKTPPQPEVLVVVPVLENPTVAAEINLFTIIAGGDQKLTWKTEPEGDETVHWATGDAKPGQFMPAYALVPGALVISSSKALVHSSLKAFSGVEKSLADSDRLQSLLGDVDRTQFLWGYVNSTAFGSLMAPEGEEKIDPNTMPGLEELLTAWEGQVFSVALRPDRIEGSALQAFDPASTLGKAIATFKAGALKSTDLAPASSTAFFAVTDMPHFSALFDVILKPMFQIFMATVGDAAGGDAFAPIAAGFLEGVENLVKGSPGEASLDFGPLNPRDLEVPSILAMIQKGDDDRSLKGINSLAQIISLVTNQQWVTTTILGTRVQTLGATKNSFRLSYALVDNFHMIGSNPDAIKMPLLQDQDLGGEPLSSDAQFKKVKAMLGPDAVIFGYINVRELGTIALENAPPDKEGDVMGPLVKEVVNDVRGAAQATNAGPKGLESRFVITYDPNATLADTARKAMKQP